MAFEEQGDAFSFLGKGFFLGLKTVDSKYGKKYREYDIKFKLQ